MEKKKLENALLIIILILLVVCMVVVVIKAVEICTLNKILTSNEHEVNNSSDNNNTVNLPNVDDEVIENKSEPFISYDDVSYIENEDLKDRVDKIDSRLRKVLALISLANDKEGMLALNDIDKLVLHALVINNFIEEDKQLILENGLLQATVSASDYEKVFTEISGIKNVKEFFKGYDLETTKDSYKSVYYEENGETYYIVPFGFGMGTGISVISDVTEKDGRTNLVIKTYDADYENNKYTHTKTTTFEIEKDGLTVYSFNVEKVK